MEETQVELKNNAMIFGSIAKNLDSLKKWKKKTKNWLSLATNKMKFIQKNEESDEEEEKWKLEMQEMIIYE